MESKGDKIDAVVQTEEVYRELKHNASSKVSISGSDHSKGVNKSNVRQVGGGGRIAKPGRLAKNSAGSIITSSVGRMNNDSSTAFGTVPPHQQSIDQQLDSNLVHNQSIEMEGYEPGQGRIITRVDPI